MLAFNTRTQPTTKQPLPPYTHTYTKTMKVSMAKYGGKVVVRVVSWDIYIYICGETVYIYIHIYRLILSR